MNEQAASGTVNALAKLSDASDAMDTHGGIDAWRILARRVARTADRLNQQGVTMTLNAVGKVPTLAEALRGTPGAWPALAEAARRTAPHMRAQGVAVVLNALWKIPDVRGHISDECLRTLARGEADGGRDDTAGGASHRDALNKLPELAAHVSKRGWARLAARTEAAVVDAPVESLGTESSPVFMFHCLARSPELSARWVPGARGARSLEKYDRPRRRQAPRRRAPRSTPSPRCVASIWSWASGVSPRGERSQSCGSRRAGARLHARVPHLGRGEKDGGVQRRVGRRARGF